MPKTHHVEQARRALKHVERAIPWLTLVAAPVGVFLVIRSQRDAISAIDWTISWEPLTVSVLAFALAPLTQGLSFWLVLRFLTGTTPLSDAMLVWGRSYVVRYAPTGALAIAYRLSARHRLHASADQVLAAYGYEHMGALAAGAGACLVLFAVAGDLPPLLPLGVALAALLLTAGLRPGLAGRAVQALAGRFGLHLSVILEGRQLAAVVALNAVGWLGTGTAVYVLVAAVTGAAPGFVWLVGSYTAGYLVGFVTPLAPGGLGAREGTLVMLLGSGAVSRWASRLSSASSTSPVSSWPSSSCTACARSVPYGRERVEARASGRWEPPRARREAAPRSNRVSDL